MQGKYIQKRRRRWYAVLEIPEAVRQHFGGKPRFVQSLQTESETVAERRAAFLVNAWKKDINEAKGQPDENDALYWRSVLKRAKTDKDRNRILEQIHEAAELIGMITVDDIGQDPTSSAEAKQFYSEAVGWTTVTKEHVDEWLASENTKEKTKAVYKADVLRFAERFPSIQQVTKPEVRRWVTRLQTEEGLAAGSVLRIMAAVRSYWRYLQSINAADEDTEPFDKIKMERGSSKKSGWLPFEPADVVKLMGAAKDDPQLVDLIDAGRWTGARIEELCSLKVQQASAVSIMIADAKTEAGIREVPVHPKLAPTIKRLIGKRKEGYLFEPLAMDKYGDRSRSISQRFSRLKRDQGFGERHVFHSIRKTVITQFENVGVAEGVAADIVGHEKPTMTFGTYSGGASMATKRKAILKLKYPE